MSAELLRARITRLEAEVSVRTVLCVPIEWQERTDADKRPGRSAAFSSGFERGYRGQPLIALYSQGWMQDSYERGWDMGRRQSEETIRKVITRT